MQFVSFLVVFCSLPLAFSQLETIGIIDPGATTSTSTLSATSSLISSLSSAPNSTSTSSVSLTSTVITTLSPNTTTTGNPLVLTTVFTQPSGCSDGITEVASWSTELWQNIVNPVPSLTLSSCYPSQFYSSAIATTTMPPYIQLVCPEDWETYNITDTYIICCPGGYGLYAPNYQNTTRPGLGAVCTSSIWANVLMDITSYDSTALATVIPTSAGQNGTLVFATAFDGTAATSVESTSSASATTSTVSSTASTITSIASPTVASKSTITTATTSLTAISQLPSCGQTCFANMLAQYDSLGCSTPDPSCLCRNINFYYGIRDCSNGACGTDVASTVIAFESGYCTSAIAAETTYPTTAGTTISSTSTAAATPTAIADLPTCGQTCFANMLAQYSSLGCTSEDPSCLCENINFYYGIRDCSNAACSTDDATTVLAFESSYCASATATASST